MKVLQIEASRIQLNQWNANELDPKLQRCLKADITANGFVQPILVRPVNGDRYEVIDGEHRLKALLELGHTDVPCVVMIHDDKQAKLRNITMNHLRGQFNIIKLAKLITELNRYYAKEELQKTLGYTNRELNGILKVLDYDLSKPVLDLPETENKIDIPMLLTFTVSKAQLEVIEAAIDKAYKVYGVENRSQALQKICECFLR